MRSATLLSVLRRPVSRVSGLVVIAAAFLLIGSGRLLGQHACPHHDGGAAHEGAAAHGPEHAAAHEGPDDGVPSPCTCIGTCHGAAATPLLPPGSLLTGAHHEFRRVPAAPTAAVGAARLVPWLLPPANGPPSRA